MNLGAHIVVAHRTSPDARAFALGAALPDLASIGGFRLLGSTTNVQVSNGIAFHHRTDDAFHRHPWFTDLQRSLGESLHHAGLARGPVRAIAHVGPELLLDGALIADHGDTIDATLQSIRPGLGSLIPLVRDEHRAPWERHLQRVAGWQPSGETHDADAVARRLHRILLRRPRLAFGQDSIDAVGELLGPVADHIDRTAAEFINEISAQLS